MIVGVCKETFPGETRVALIPASVGDLRKLGAEVVVERGAGVAAGYPDAAYEAAGAKLVDDRDALFAAADVIVAVRIGGADPDGAAADAQRLGAGKTVIAVMEPLYRAEVVKSLVDTGATLLALELIPRITRAQSMDILSSMATVSGYKAVLLAASTLRKMFPMMMTAAGTITPAKVLVIGAGVAGLQAISTARRLGAVVSGYDVRAAVKEQVQSLGAKFVELPLEIDAEGSGGYAKEQTAEQLQKQQELMADVIAESDVVITTAAVPGRRSPVIVTRAMVARMAPGSVIVDIAAEKGGNCELTKLDETVVSDNGVTILGPGNLPATVPFHASQMFAKNVVTLLKHLSKNGALTLDLNDEITAGTLVGQGGEILHPQVRAQLGLPERATAKES